MATGRAFASTAVTVSQTDAKGRDRVCTRSLVLLNAPDPDLIRHQDEAPDVGSPEDASSGGHGPEFWEVRTVGGVDISDPAAVGPAELRVWTRFDGAPKDQTLNRALLRVRDRRVPHRHRDASARGNRPVDGPRVDLDDGGDPHAHLPRGRRRR